MNQLFCSNASGNGKTNLMSVLHSIVIYASYTEFDSADLLVDCEQSLFSSKIRGEERKTNSRAIVPVNVTYERRGASSAGVGKRALPEPTLLAASTLVCFASFPTVFEEERDCLQSNLLAVVTSCV